MSKEKRTKPLGTQRIPFGRNGIKDENGNIIRTDHMNMGDVIRNMLDGGPTKEQLIDKRINDAVDGVVSMKKRQDKLAGIKRRKA